VSHARIFLSGPHRTRIIDLLTGVVVIPNASFEAMNEEGIEDWQLQGGNARDFIGTEGAHSGKRFILLRPTGSALSWRSKAVPIKPGSSYGLSWWMRIGGNRPWHWTYWTDFTGVRVEFLSSDGSLLKVVERRLRSLRTQGWKRAWVILKAPSEAYKARVIFALDSRSDIEMEMHVDDVAMEEIPGEIPEGLGRLKIRAYIEGQNKPAFARFFVEDESSEFHWPSYSFPFKSGLFYHMNDPELNYLDLQPGTYHLRVTKGPEFEPVEAKVLVESGQQAEVNLRIRRMISMPASNWFGGDHHVHLFFHKDTTHPQMTIDDVMKVAKGEGLNFVSFCGEWSELTANLGNHEIGRDDEFVGEVGLESVNDFYGHMCTLGWNSIPPQGIPMRLVPWPMNTDTIESLEEQRGAWVNAHPFDSITPGKVIEEMGNPDKLCNARELPIILALGHRTNMDILCHATPGGAELKTHEYYRLLNMGFKIGVTASTDYYVDQARGTPGHNRTYVRASSLDFSAITEAYRNGRTFATNGPVVDFQVEGVGVGDELTLPEDRHRVKAKITAFSRMGLERAKVILNGEVYKTFSAEGRWIKQEFEVPVERSSWIAIHLEGPVDRDIEPWDLTPDQRNLKSQFAHTSPVYIRVGTEGIRPRKEDVRFLLDWLDAALRAFHSQRNIWNGYPDESYLATSYSPDERRKITARFEERVEKAKQALLNLKLRE